MPARNARNAAAVNRRIRSGARFCGRADRAGCVASAVGLAGPVQQPVGGRQVVPGLRRLPGRDVGRVPGGPDAGLRSGRRSGVVLRRGIGRHPVDLGARRRIVFALGPGCHHRRSRQSGRLADAGGGGRRRRRLDGWRARRGRLCRRVFQRRSQRRFRVFLEPGPGRSRLDGGGDHPPGGPRFRPAAPERLRCRRRQAGGVQPRRCGSAARHGQLLYVGPQLVVVRPQQRRAGRPAGRSGSADRWPQRLGLPRGRPFQRIGRR